MTPDQSIAQSFNALAHKNRAKLFRILTQIPGTRANYSALQEITRMSDATLTHHLRVMELAGLVRRHRKGRVVEYLLQTGALLVAMNAAQDLVSATKANLAA